MSITPHHDRMFLNFGKMTKATFVYLYCASSCHKTLKRSSDRESWDITLHSFGPNLAQIALAQKGNIFGNLTVTLM